MLRKIACGILRRAASPCIDTNSPEAWFHPALTIGHTAVATVQFHFPFSRALVHARVEKIPVHSHPVQSRIFLRNQQKGGSRLGAR